MLKMKHNILQNTDSQEYHNILRVLCCSRKMCEQVVTLNKIITIMF